jgi:hypothetical protein
MDRLDPGSLSLILGQAPGSCQITALILYLKYSFQNNLLILKAPVYGRILQYIVYVVTVTNLLQTYIDIACGK